MVDSFYVKKKQLLVEMKDETIAQLRAIESEDAEEFLRHVQRCEKLIHLLDALNESEWTLISEQEKEIHLLLQKIMQIRQQITPLLLPLRNKFQQGAVRERKSTTIRRGYGNEDAHPPSVFFDTKN